MKICEERRKRRDLEIWRVGRNDRLSGYQGVRDGGSKMFEGSVEDR